MIKKQKQKQNESIQDYINLLDIKGNFLYTKDGYIAQYIKVMPISTALMTPAEKAQLTIKMSRAISPTKTAFKIIFLTRPTDVRQIIDYYESIKASTNDGIKRESLTQTIRFFSQLATGGAVLERQTFLRLKGKTQEEVKSKTYDMCNALAASSITCHVCDEQEIVNMLGLFYSPTFDFSTPVDMTNKMTFLETSK